MAKIQTVTFVDDLDGKELEPDDQHTISWTWLGVDYQLDVSGANLDKIENGKVTVAKLLDSSTRIGGRKRSTAGRVAAPAPSAPARGGSSNTSDIREWATENGYSVSPRGRIAREVIEAYEAAH
ncbi:Lsr2 family protein [Gordonia sp. (in: high G+C Gram-positive bacteria)]|jgi:hypothetical protein|uniref:histone-like nucleoid-structuring protein Lsr2 n=1 Tax=Gordonia sp. (in: high G+C Gram-positive bacteria) TaxID=84139 RepID=UPI001DC916F3|nr:Lsr2 family protein [Gordonia sp. (in: high G+C Gram-positive bacteria)]MCB1294945.1 Lsr2 family protein [Gordonia sp. (in: high G+C Gram-positive bacteria)]HMS75561.1 Lsr2 family protein [Gordonia sp. (in: high G+C Gram-positive bacteria)]HQV17957.1 Lsr2 family protein [Gordonia sp. (in: high G+C Gram-positive bacteria)]